MVLTSSTLKEPETGVNRLRSVRSHTCMHASVCPHALWGNMGNWVPKASGKEIVGAMKTKSICQSFDLEIAQVWVFRGNY